MKPHVIPTWQPNVLQSRLAWLNGHVGHYLVKKWTTWLFTIFSLGIQKYFL
jgi:hypothetical protein